mmetsp:Transcript_45428/g.83089  ORF Transcript_45428/g.83089 Transcript_45428/m.83089 type:complete len:83 (-) Transcript_45428:1701-1949(-)
MRNAAPRLRLESYWLWEADWLWEAHSVLAAPELHFVGVAAGLPLRAAALLRGMQLHVLAWAWLQSPSCHRAVEYAAVVSERT